MAPTTSLNKSVVAIRYWLLAKEYFQALRAMEWAFDHHRGTRKDGTTPIISHQLSVVYYLRTVYQNLLYPEQTFCVAFLHDIAEDCNVPIQDISNNFGEGIAAAVRLLSKEYHGMDTPPKETENYYMSISDNCIASITKAADRIHNVQTMVGVFNKEKQKQYIKETNEYVIPMIKRARRIFPQQEPSYENAKHMLKCQIELIEAIHGRKRC